MNLNDSSASHYLLLVESNSNPPMTQWFGEGEKYVKAIFSLASKIAPTVVFVDEVSCSINQCHHLYLILGSLVYCASDI